jgi:TIR domain
MANVFISHRKQDDTEATQLAEELRSAGHSVWLDEWEIGLGDSIVAKMNEGLTGPVRVVLCYSSSDVLSPWISREWMSALARQLDGHDVRILPVRLTGGDPPALLADIKYADLVKDWPRGIRELLAALR